MSPNLVSGPDGLRRAQQLLAGAPLCALASYPAVAHEPRRGHAPPHQASEPLRLLGMASATDQLVLDVQRTPSLGSIWPAGRAVAAFDGQRLQHMLWRADAGAPARWASLTLNAQLLGAHDRPPATLAALAETLDVPAPTPLEGGLEALAEHARVTLAAAQRQATLLREAGMADIARLEAAAVTPIAALEAAGLPFDVHRLQAVLRRERDWLAHHIEAGAAPAEVRSVRHLQQTVGDAFLAHVSRAGRLHAQFVQIGASSGRMATRTPNVQGIPKQGERRACVRAAHGHLLVTGDYAACELRILAHLSGDAAYQAAFAAGEDVHQAVAGRLFGAAHSEAERASRRAAAKALSFGLVYGMQPAGFARRLQCSEAEAQRHVATFFGAYPQIRAYLEAVAARGARTGEVRTLLGRRLALADGDRARRERLARNLPIQGCGADIIKRCLPALAQALHAIAGAQTVHVVHDSLMVECRADDAAAVQQQLQHTMHQAAATIAPKVSWQVDTEVGQAWQ